MGWLLYGIAVLMISGLIGLHLGRFREAYTEMTGMMAGMTMGMLNGFLLGYAAAATIGSVAAASGSMFWGNLFGILLGILLGVYFGRAGGLMGIMDGAMGGVMGGSMGAMLAVMTVFPSWAQFWTGVLLAVIYVIGMIGLVVLIERSAPGHEALHRLAPMFTRAMSQEADEREVRKQKQAQVRTRANAGIPTRASDAAANVPTRASSDIASANIAVRASVPARRSQNDQRTIKVRRPAARVEKRSNGSGPIVGMGLVILLGLGALVWMLGSLGSNTPSGGATSMGDTNGLPADFVSKLESQAVAASTGADGKQTLDLIVNGNTRGYKPSVIKVKQGVPVHFNLSVEGSDPG